MLSSAATTAPSRTVTLSAPSPSTRVIAPMRMVRVSATSRLLTVVFREGPVHRSEPRGVAVEAPDEPRQVAGVVAVAPVPQTEAEQVRVFLRAEAAEALAVVTGANHLAA